MKELAKEFRQYLAEKLLIIAWNIAPKSRQGAALKNAIWAYFFKLNIKDK
jgi:hypothetical protein